MKSVIRAIGALLLVAYAVGCVWIHVTNIDATEMRLLVTYWPFYLSVLLPIALIAFGGDKN